VAKANSVVDVGMLEFCIRELLNKSSLRRMAVLRPLKVVITNYPEGSSEELEAINHPDDPTAGTRKIRALIDPNTAELWTGPISGFRHAPNVAALRRPAA